MKGLSCAEARRIDLVAYLSTLGYHAIRIRGNDYWYYSPLRKERTPSFKVNRSMNVFYDHGSGEGGNIIDFGILYHVLNVHEFLQMLAKDFPNSYCLSKTLLDTTAKEEIDQTTCDRKTVVTDTRPIESRQLINYLLSRYIDPEIARRHCRQVAFMLNGKNHMAIGFANSKGGYELRNTYFKGSSAPKAFTFIDNGYPIVTVFEGFFDLLSYHTIEQDNPFAMTNYLVLNSLVFFQKTKDIMESHLQINLQLDRDASGIACTLAALKSNSKYRDCSGFYKEFKDLNEWLIRSRRKK